MSGLPFPSLYLPHLPSNHVGICRDQTAGVRHQTAGINSGNRLSVGVICAMQAALVVGFGVTLVLAWYHGEQGRQRVSGPELLIIAGVLIVAGMAGDRRTRSREDHPARGFLAWRSKPLRGAPFTSDRREFSGQDGCVA